MDLKFTDEQDMLRKMARDFLDKEFPKKLVRELEENPSIWRGDIWKKMADLGWMGLAIPEKYGGSGGSFMDLTVLLEEMGRACLISPFFSTVVCALALLDAGSEEQKKKYLPGIASGEAIFSLALTEPSVSYDAAGIKAIAKATGNGYSLSGAKLFVEGAANAGYLLCVARTGTGASPEDGIGLFIVEAGSPGVKISPLPTISADRQAEVVFTDVAVPAGNVVGEPGKGWPVVSRLLEKAAVAKCGEMIGGAEWVLEASIQYARERIQYGRPIGSFQALQHIIADMWADLKMAKENVYFAVTALDKGLPCTAEVAMAKAMMSDAAWRTTRMGIQIHGGIGTTRDHDAGLYYRRANQSLFLYGSPEFWREKLAVQLGI